VLGIFVDMVNDYLDIFMDAFTLYGNEFNESLQKLEKILTVVYKPTFVSTLKIVI